METCPLCGGTFDRTDFIGLVPGDDRRASDVTLVHRDDVGEDGYLVCIGCSVRLGRSAPHVIAMVVFDLMFGAA